MNFGYELEAESAKSQRSLEDQPTVMPMRAGKNPAERKRPDSDERKARRRKAVTASFSTPGYYVINTNGGPEDGPFLTYSQAIAHLNGRAGIQYMEQAPGATAIKPFPPQLQQVNGSAHMASDWEDSFWFTAADDDDDKKKMPWDKDDDSDSDDDKEDDDDDQDNGKDSDDDDDDDDKDSSDSDKDSENDDSDKPPWLNDKKSALLPIQIREARLLKAIANANPRDASRLMAELEGIRYTESLRLQADRELDLSNKYVEATLTPVVSFKHHTAGTDWISAEADYADNPGDVESNMLTEAAIWWNKTPGMVKADSEELFAQASGMAQRSASQYPYHTKDAYDTFMGHVAFLHNRTAAESGTPDPWNEETMSLDDTQIVGDNYNQEQNAQPPREWETNWLDNGASGSPDVEGSTVAALKPGTKPGECQCSNIHAAPSQDCPVHGSKKANKRVVASEYSDEKRESYDDYLARVSEGAWKMTPDEYPGSLSASSPAEGTTIPTHVTSAINVYESYLILKSMHSWLHIKKY